LKPPCALHVVADSLGSVVTVQRVDIGPLARPVRTPQGFLIVEGIASRCGVFEYLRADGSIQRELRLPDDVFSDRAMLGYQGAPLTKGHPANPVTSQNAKMLAVGTVLEPARADGENVRVKMAVHDASAVAALESRRTTALSTGYTVDLDETPGVHPVYGRFDATQRGLTINHLALVDSGRAGPIARVRMDGDDVAEADRSASWSTGWRGDAGIMVAGGMGVEGSMATPWSMNGTQSDADGPGAVSDAMFTTVEEGHQHSIDPDDDFKDDEVGRTSWATSEGAESPHCHEYIRNPDGTFVIAMNEGHDHKVVPPAPALAPEKTPPEVPEGGSAAGYASAETPKNDSSRTRTPRSNSTLRGRPMQTRNQPTNTPAATGGAAPSGAAPAGRQPPQPGTGAPRIDTRPGRPAAARAGESPVVTAQVLTAAADELAREKARADDAERRLTEETARADAAEGSYEAVITRLEQAEANQRDDELIQAKDDQIETLKRRVGELEDQRNDARDPKHLETAVRERVRIERASGPILGLDRMDHLSNRELMEAVVVKVQGADCSGKGEEYVRARFDVAVANRINGLRALDRIREVVDVSNSSANWQPPARASNEAPRADNRSSRQKYLDTQQNGWKQPGKTAAGN
jgi:hypothetical protein